MDQGFCFVISAPSGCGKTTICNYLTRNNSSTIKSTVSYTTRPPRANEIDGVHYHFVTVEHFLNMVKNNQFIEHALIFNNYYGTSINDIKDITSNNFDALCEVNWEGRKNIVLSNNFRISSVFLIPETIADLRNRIIKRNENNADDMKLRLSEVDIDLANAKDYDYIILNKNDNLDETCQVINSIYIAEKAKFSKQKRLDFIRDMLI